MPRILIAEDDPQVGSLLEKGFQDKGFSTHVVDDGEQARAQGLTDDFDLLILDIGLPDRPGLEVLQDLRSRGMRIPVLVLTGRREYSHGACLDAGADDYMGKPFHFRDLLSRVQVLLQGPAPVNSR